MNQRERKQALDESLRRLGLVAEGVKTCVVVSDDGFPIAAFATGSTSERAGDSLSAAQVAAVSARLTGQAERTLDRLAQGDMGRLLLEGADGTLLNCPAGDVTLALVIEPGASMGHVMFAAQKAASEIETILARR